MYYYIVVKIIVSGLYACAADPEVRDDFSTQHNIILLLF